MSSLPASIAVGSFGTVEYSIATEASYKILVSLAPVVPVVNPVSVSNVSDIL
jgi:hypothetical protein